ncbi:MAG: GNAT family N-acetyltransferase [Spirochaetia bacterium]|nr:GNAT family N-acetyltransferase [Spirochaetia bacterium]
MEKLKIINNTTIIEADTADVVSKGDIVKISLPTSNENEILMFNNGFKLVERTIQTDIHVLKIDLNLDKLIRLNVEETTKYKKEIENIALKSFPYDRRFHLRINFDDEDLFESIMKEWIDDLESVLVAKFKDTVVGFLALKETAEDTLFVHLAAVDEKYRLTGAAMSLYSKAVQIAKDKGYKTLEGRISTRNTAVMNLYSYFDAHFENPIDIYLREYDKENQQ